MSTLPEKNGASDKAVEPPSATFSPTRRGFAATILMIVGLVAGYGLGAIHFFRYLVPLGRKGRRRELFVGTLREFQVGTSKTIRDPRGEGIALTRVSKNENNPAAGFKALSSTCPHLGCRVHWEGANERFFCPCHNGVFDKDGIATDGPPAKEGKNLSTYEVRVNAENGWVYVMVTEPARYGA